MDAFDFLRCVGSMESFPNERDTPMGSVFRYFAIGICCFNLHDAGRATRIFVVFLHADGGFGVVHIGGFVNPVQGLESVAGIEGAWRGALEQKNMLGIASGVALLLWVFVQTTFRRSTFDSVASISVILICLLGSRSSSSLFFGMASVGLYFVLYKDYIRAASLFLRFFLILAGLFLLANILFFLC